MFYFIIDIYSFRYINEDKECINRAIQYLTVNYVTWLDPEDPGLVGVTYTTPKADNDDDDEEEEEEDNEDINTIPKFVIFSIHQPDEVYLYSHQEPETIEGLDNKFMACQLPPWYVGINCC
jgi:hypothetical protein